MAVPMVGRAPALDELRRSWEYVQDRHRPVTAVLTGAAGTGKSTLVAALREIARPVAVLAGAARVHSPAPYDWLAAVLAGRDTTGLDVPPDALSWLKQDPDVPRERYTPDALLRIAVAVVRALVGAVPALVVVEDLHALDPASLNLVAELARTDDLPALLLVTSQPPEAAVSPPLTARTLARLAGSPGALRHHLGGLSEAEVGELLTHAYGSAVTGELVSAVCRRTGGNPYRITELVAELGPAGLGPEGMRPDGMGARGARGRRAEAPGARDLTAREREVLGCLAEGMPNKQIARALGISVRTVTVHVSNLLRKNGAASRTEAASWALRGDVPAPRRGSVA
jgi:two-component system, NarL family, nitrate/nitrite response regulator NarL